MRLALRLARRGYGATSPNPPAKEFVEEFYQFCQRHHKPMSP
jgi:hypothetical protein